MFTHIMNLNYWRLWDWSVLTIKGLDHSEISDCCIWIIASALVPFWGSLWVLSISLRCLTIQSVRPERPQAWQFPYTLVTKLYLSITMSSLYLCSVFDVLLCFWMCSFSNKYSSILSYQRFFVILSMEIHSNKNLHSICFVNVEKGNNFLT